MRFSANNLQRAGVRNLIAGSPKITDQEHAARQLARPLESLALYLDDPAAIILPNEPRNVDPLVIAIHPGSGSEKKNWPLERFIALATALFRANEDSRLLLIGGEADEVRSDAAGEELLPGERVSMATNLPLPDAGQCAAELRILYRSRQRDFASRGGGGHAFVPALRPDRPGDLGAAKSAGASSAVAGLTMEGIARKEVVAHRESRALSSRRQRSQLQERAYELMRIGIRT